MPKKKKRAQIPSEIAAKALFLQIALAVSAGPLANRFRFIILMKIPATITLKILLSYVLIATEKLKFEVVLIVSLMEAKLSYIEMIGIELWQATVSRQKR